MRQGRSVAARPRPFRRRLAAITLGPCLRCTLQSSCWFARVPSRQTASARRSSSADSAAIADRAAGRRQWGYFGAKVELSGGDANATRSGARGDATIRRLALAGAAAAGAQRQRVGACARRSHPRRRQRAHGRDRGRRWRGAGQRRGGRAARDLRDRPRSESAWPAAAARWAGAAQRSDRPGADDDAGHTLCCDPRGAGAVARAVARALPDGRRQCAPQRRTAATVPLRCPARAHGRGAARIGAGRGPGGQRPPRWSGCVCRRSGLRKCWACRASGRRCWCAN